MAFHKFGHTIQRQATTVTAAGTTTLLNNSPSYQQFTGTTTQTVVLPDATTCPIGMKFVIQNRSTGIVTINLNGGSLAATVAAGSQRKFQVYNISSSPGVWNVTNEVVAPSIGLATTDTLSIIAALATGNYQDANTLSKTIPFNLEEIGGNFWTTRTPPITDTWYRTGFDLGGHAYALGGVGATTINERYDDVNNFWISRAATSTQRIFGTGFAVSGFGFVSGNDANSTSNEKYNDLTNAWSTVQALPAGSGYAAGMVLDDYGVRAGGYNGATIATVLFYSPSADAWYSRQPLTAEYSANNGDVLNGFGYVVAGDNAAFSHTSITQVYSPALNSWAASGSLVGGGRQYNNVFALNGLLYTASGYDGSPMGSTEEYSDVSRSWLARTSLLTARFGAAKSSLNGSGYAFGGSVTGGGSAATTVERYRNVSFVSLGIFRKSTSAPTAIYAAMALNNLVTALPIQVRTDGDNWKTFMSSGDNALKTGETYKPKFKPSSLPYWAGGTPDNATSQTTMQFYNDPANSWITRQGMGSTRSGHGSFTVNGNGYAFEGQGTSGANRHSAEKYDDILDAWTSVTAIPATWTPLGIHGFEIEGFGYGVGGSTNTANYNAAVTTNYKYDPDGNSWSLKTVMTAGIAGGYSANQNGRGFVAGGHAVGGANSSTNYRYNAILDSWSSLAIMSGARAEGCGGSSLNGFSYAVGGSGGPANADKFNDQTNAWAVTASMSANHGAASQSAPSANGFVYAAGNGLASATSEKFNDASNIWESIASPSTNLAYGSAGASSGNYRNYEVRVALPAYIAGLGAGAWVTKSSLSTGRIQAAGFSLNGFGIAVGGNAALSSTEVYSQDANAWRFGAVRPVGDAGIRGCALLGFGYTFSGVSSATYQYNDQAQTWTATGAADPNFGGGHAIPWAQNGFLFGTGGAGTLLTRRYDPSTNAFTGSLASIPGSTARYYAAAETLEGFGYVVGDNTSPYSATSRYNDTGNYWTVMATTNARRDALHLFQANGFIHLNGGNLAGDVLTSEKYLHSSDVWINTSPSTSTRSLGIGFTLGGTGIVGGGQTNPTVVEQYIPSLNNIAVSVALKVSE